VTVRRAGQGASGSDAPVWAGLTERAWPDRARLTPAPHALEYEHTARIPQLASRSPSRRTGDALAPGWRWPIGRGANRAGSGGFTLASFVLGTEIMQENLTGYMDGVIAGKPLAYASVRSSTLLGLEPHLVTIEVSCTRGPPLFRMVGLPEAPVREARVRIASALAVLGVLLDEYAITINLAPADIPKSGAMFDLALAVGVLGALSRFPAHHLDGVLVLGELSLDGSLQAVQGVLPQLRGMLGRGAHTAIVPTANAIEAGLLRSGRVLVARSLEDVLQHLSGERALPSVSPTPFAPVAAVHAIDDLSCVRGQREPRRALEIAAAGNHNLLMVGPPGGGKTLLARLLPSILPPLTYEEAVEATAIHSVAGVLARDKGMVDCRPFRAPHHSISQAGLVGGGSRPRPGEVSLAHHGVLFMDEFAEFRRSALEAMRQPLEDGVVCIARAQARAWFPARPMVVAAMNECPCGYRGHARERCRCTPAQVDRYRQKLSGPLLDRLDVHVRVRPVEVRELARLSHAESSQAVRERVLAARQRQLGRFERGDTKHWTNAELSLSELDTVAPLDDDGRDLLERSALRLGLSARAYVKVLRVARTIADLAGSDLILPVHVSEAVHGRLLDRRPLEVTDAA
jgi:magnesium chelatase family protein